MIKKQYIERLKGKNSRKPVWKGSYKKWEVTFYQFKPWSRGKTKSSSCQVTAVCRYLSSITITFALVLPFSLRMQYCFPSGTCWYNRLAFYLNQNRSFYIQVLHTPHVEFEITGSARKFTLNLILIFYKFFHKNTLLIQDTSVKLLLQNCIKKLDHKTPTFLTPQNPELLS